MKLTSLLSFIIIFSSSICFAQPTINESNFGYTSTGTFPIRGIWQNTVGSPGANVTWNLNTSSPSSFDTIYTEDPINSTFSTNFPNANVRIAEYAITPETFYIVNADGLYINGAVKSNVVYSYSNDDLLIPFPMTFGNSNTDNWECSFNDGAATIRTGTTTTLADGYGTLVLPSGTYNDVVRLKILQKFTDKVNNTVIRTDSILRYLFCKPTIHYPVYHYYNRYTNGLQSNYMYYLDPITPLGVDNRAHHAFIDFFPNPASSELNVKFESENKNRRIQLMNSLGQIIKTVSANNRNRSMDVSHLRNGNYSLHILIGDQRTSGEIITIKH